MAARKSTSSSVGSEVKIAILAVPMSRSSWVMARFEEAGFFLGDVDRRICEKYPAGRLELWPLARATHSRSKADPLPREYWPELDLTGVRVAKCMPAWIECLRVAGFNYWVAVKRGSARADRYPHDEVLYANQDFDPRAIYARACDAILSRNTVEHTDQHAAA